MSCYAALDLGSNTFRILGATPVSQPPFYRIHFMDRIVVRMGEGVSLKGEFSESAMERGLGALEKFAFLMKECQEYRAVATGVFREAANSSKFVQMALAETNIKVEIISAGEEALLSFVGAVNEVAVERNGTMFLDIGGGSFEVALQDGESFLWESVPWGAVKILDRFKPGAPSDPGKIREIKNFLVELWRKLYNKFKTIPQRAIVTGGTVTTLIMLHLGESVYKRELFNGFRIDGQLVRKWIDLLAPLTLEERGRLKGMEKGREDILLTGLLILETFMEIFNLTAVINSEGGLLEGVWLSLKERSSHA